MAYPYDDEEDIRDAVRRRGEAAIRGVAPTEDGAYRRSPNLAFRTIAPAPARVVGPERAREVPVDWWRRPAGREQPEPSLPLPWQEPASGGPPPPPPPPPVARALPPPPRWQPGTQPVIEQPAIIGMESQLLTSDERAKRNGNGSLLTALRLYIRVLERRLAELEGGSGPDAA